MHFKKSSIGLIFVCKKIYNYDGVSMIVNMKNMLSDAKKNKYAIPHFNINNLEWAKFILEECNINNSPVILGVSESSIDYMGGFNVVSGLIYDLIHDLKITIPVVLHLDHGSFDGCVKAMEANFSSVMIDASNYPINENIEVTKRIIEKAGKSITVEAEVGNLEQTNETLISDCTLMSNIGITCLAPAVGNKHGIYTEEPKLDFDKIKEISLKTNLPLVLHGCSGISDEDLKKAIENGICKININTDLQIAWANSVKDYISKNPDVYDPRKIIKSGELGLKRKIKNILITIGSIYRG